MPSSGEDARKEGEEEKQSHGTWTVCAQEGQTCRCGGTVVYGRKYSSLQPPGRGEENGIEETKGFPFSEAKGVSSIECSESAMSKSANAAKEATEGTKHAAPEVAEKFTKHCMCLEQSPGEMERASGAGNDELRQ